ncbi:hypothetical protein [Megalodesulfovibrio paquesii]
MELNAIAGGTSAFAIAGYSTGSTFGSLSIKTPSNSSSAELGNTFGQAVVLQLQSGLSKDEGLASSLADALGGSMDYLRNEFGDATAQAAMAMVAKRLDDAGQISEEDISKGLLDAVRLVDGTYGFAAGDNVMRQFNGDLNDALNAYFDNGLQERFFASSSMAADGSSAPSGIVLADFMPAAEGDAADAAVSPMASLLDALQDDLNSTLEKADEQAAAADPSQLELQQGLLQYDLMALGGQPAGSFGTTGLDLRI